MDKKESLQEKLRRVNIGKKLPAAGLLVVEDLFLGVSKISKNDGLMEIYESKIWPWKAELGYDTRLAQLVAIVEKMLEPEEYGELLMAILIEPFAALPKRKKEEKNKWEQS